MPEKERNDAIAEVDCKRKPECCKNPRWVNQFGDKDCWCINCGKRCMECREDYLRT